MQSWRQDTQLASWLLGRRANGSQWYRFSPSLYQVQNTWLSVQSPDNQKNDDISSSSMADTLKTQEEAMSQPESQGQKNTDIPAQSGRRNSLTWGRVSLFVLARPSTDWMGATHIREGLLSR